MAEPLIPVQRRALPSSQSSAGQLPTGQAQGSGPRRVLEQGQDRMGGRVVADNRGSLFGSFSGGQAGPAGQFFDEADRTRVEEDQRRLDTIGFLEQSREQAGINTITPDVVANLFGNAITQVGRGAQGANQDLFNQAGGEGTIGGGGLGAARGSIEGARLSALSQQQSSIANLVAQDRASSRMRQLQVDQVLAGVLNQDPAMQTADALGALFGGSTQIQIGRENIEAAKDAADAAEPEWWEIALGALPVVGSVAKIFSGGF